MERRLPAASARNRNIALDIAKGLGILLVILGHCSEIPYRPVRHLIFTFHMPLFFLIAGYLWRAKPVAVSLRKDARRLLLPYAATCAAIIVMSFALCSLRGDGYRPVLHWIAASVLGSGSVRSTIFLSRVPDIGAIWFLPALWVCKNAYNMLQHHSLRRRLAISAAIYLISYLIGRYVIFIPMSVLSGLTAIIFYAIGDALKQVNSIKWPWLITGLACWAISFQFSYIYLVQPKMDFYAIDIAGAVTASLLLYALSRKIGNFTAAAKPLAWLGTVSLNVLCFHIIDGNFHISRTIASLSSGHPVATAIISLLLKVLIPIAAAALMQWAKQKRKMPKQAPS